MEMQVRFGRKQGQLDLHLIMLLLGAAFFAMICAVVAAVARWPVVRTDDLGSVCLANSSVLRRHTGSTTISFSNKHG
jgi:hypothetical protein